MLYYFNISICVTLMQTPWPSTHFTDSQHHNYKVRTSLDLKGEATLPFAAQLR